MKLLSIGAFVLLVASAASLVSGGQSSKILQQSWLQAADVLPERTINELETRHCVKMWWPGCGVPSNS